MAHWGHRSRKMDVRAKKSIQNYSDFKNFILTMYAKMWLNPKPKSNSYQVIPELSTGKLRSLVNPKRTQRKMMLSVQRENNLNGSRFLTRYQDIYFNNLIKKINVKSLGSLQSYWVYSLIIIQAK